MRIDSAQFLEHATRVFEERAGDASPDEDLRVWKGALDMLREALSRIEPDHPFSVSRKAERLAWGHQNVFFEGKILTDLRPVFSAAGDKLLQSVVTHSLLIDYFEGNRVVRLELGLDVSDVAELRKVCERAELKSITLREALKALPWASNLLPDDGKK